MGRTDQVTLILRHRTHQARFPYICTSRYTEPLWLAPGASMSTICASSLSIFGSFAGGTLLAFVLFFQNAHEAFVLARSWISLHRRAKSEMWSSLLSALRLFKAVSNWYR